MTITLSQIVEQQRLVSPIINTLNYKFIAHMPKLLQGRYTCDKFTEALCESSGNIMSLTFGPSLLVAINKNEKKVHINLVASTDEASLRILLGFMVWIAAFSY